MGDKMKYIILVWILLLNISQAGEVEKLFYKTTCELGKSNITISACNELAKLYAYPKDKKETNYKEAEKYFSIACEGNNRYACYEMSAIYYQGRIGIDKNISKANQFSIKACDLGSYDACHTVGYMYDSGLKIEKVDKDKAITFLGRACQKNISSSCMQLADNYANKSLEKYYNLDTAHKFYQRAISHFESRCHRKEGFSCGYLGEIYYLGKYKKVDYPKAKEYFKKECEYNSDNGGCLHLGYMTLYSKDKNATKALPLLQKACELKFGLSCSLIGDIYLGKGDRKRANNFYDKAIIGYKELADEFNVLADFHKVFEISLIQNRAFDKKLIEKYFKLYQEHDSYLINYKIVKLFEETYQGKEPNIEAFIKKYRGTGLYKGGLGYDFPHIKVWIDTMEDKEMKQKLLRAYEILGREFFSL